MNERAQSYLQPKPEPVCEAASSGRGAAVLAFPLFVATFTLHQGAHKLYGVPFNRIALTICMLLLSMWLVSRLWNEKVTAVLRFLTIGAFVIAMTTVVAGEKPEAPLVNTRVIYAIADLAQRVVIYVTLTVWMLELGRPFIWPLMPVQVVHFVMTFVFMPVCNIRDHIPAGYSESCAAVFANSWMIPLIIATGAVWWLAVAVWQWARR